MRVFLPFQHHNPTLAMKKNTFLIVFTLCDSSENAHNHFNGIGAYIYLCNYYPGPQSQR